MKFTPHLLLAAAALLAAALAADSWFAARHAAAQLAATLASQNAQIAQSSAQQHQHDAQLAAALAEIAAGKRRVQTPQQAAAALPSVLPPLPLPVSLLPPQLSPHLVLTPALDSASVLPSPNPVNPPSVTAALPQIAAGKGAVATPQQAASATEPSAPAPGSLLLPPADLKPLYDALADCRVCVLERDALKSDLASEQAKTAALTRERDAALTAARGGPFWSRVKRAAKWFAIGAVVGALAASSPHH